jgi:hypothetical protein
LGPETSSRTERKPAGIPDGAPLGAARPVWILQGLAVLGPIVDAEDQLDAVEAEVIVGREAHLDRPRRRQLQSIGRSVDLDAGGAVGFGLQAVAVQLADGTADHGLQPETIGPAVEQLETHRHGALLQMNGNLAAVTRLAQQQQGAPRPPQRGGLDLHLRPLHGDDVTGRALHDAGGQAGVGRVFVGDPQIPHDGHRGHRRSLEATGAVQQRVEPLADHVGRQVCGGEQRRRAGQGEQGSHAGWMHRHQPGRVELVERVHQLLPECSDQHR